MNMSQPANQLPSVGPTLGRSTTARTNSVSAPCAHRPYTAAMFLIRLLVLVLLVAACSPNVTPSSNPTEGSGAPTPTSPPSAQGSPGPCSAEVSQLGVMTRQLADSLVSLRPLLVASPFNSGQTVAAVRRVSAVMTNYVGLEESLGACDSTIPLVAPLAGLRSSADAVLEDALSASITDGRTQWDAGARLMALLPEILAISDTAATVAGSLGVEVAMAQVPAGATDPVDGSNPFPTPSPEPTPQPTPEPPAGSTALVITSDYFGPGATVRTYRVKGKTPAEITNSINREGPYYEWLGGTASGVTRTNVTYRFHKQSSTFSPCEIVIDAEPPVALSFKIELPRWKAPARASASTIKWWNGQVRTIADHEKVHVGLYRDAAKRLIASIRSSTCENVDRHLKSIWKDAQRDNCEFDLKEYGNELGLTLKACLKR